MFLFLDESFRKHRRTNDSFGTLAGVLVPERRFVEFHNGVYHARRPYHDRILPEDGEIKGQELLGNATLKRIARGSPSYQWNLAQELLDFTAAFGCTAVGVVCFREDLHTFVNDDAHRLAGTFRALFERADAAARHLADDTPVKVVFDNRDFSANEKNARAMSNFLLRSAEGRELDRIIPMPLFGVSQAHNHGLQVADLVTTVIARRFQGDGRVEPLWRTVNDRLLRRIPLAGRDDVSTLRVIRPHQKREMTRRPRPMAE